MNPSTQGVYISKTAPDKVFKIDGPTRPAIRGEHLESSFTSSAEQLAFLFPPALLIGSGRKNLP